MAIWRVVDWIFIGFFILNLTFIVPFFDIEQIIIKDPNNFKQPLWPFPALTRLIHGYAKKYEPLLWARPSFWQATIWIDAFFFLPFYAFAAYSFYKKNNKIRDVSIIWATALIVNCTLIMFEEIWGIHKATHFEILLPLYIPYFGFPIVHLVRIFTRRRLWDQPEGKKQDNVRREGKRKKNN
ncbi:MAG: hypothetical protein EZS28_032598 [Streblomastix strix]|uniref:EXPERA domain-containing protein n=1 Tax=Streblomastix strix TaxID=222440 RepID=A0A5J4UNH1_9EUKA|nr:MAG: hypothetical protein EZS28_032598 [Streblomastix strix]